MARTPPDFSFETAAHARALAPVAGVDEVGRGPLAGPVTAAAVILDPAATDLGFAWFQEPGGKIWWTLLTGG